MGGIKEARVAHVVLRRAFPFATLVLVSEAFVFAGHESGVPGRHSDTISTYADRKKNDRRYGVVMKVITLVNGEDEARSAYRKIATVASLVGLLDLCKWANHEVLREGNMGQVCGEVAFQC